MRNSEFFDINVDDLASQCIISRCVMTLTRGVKSKFPCLVCLIPHEELSKPGQSGPFQHQSIKQVLQTVLHTREAGNAEEREAILSSESL